MKWPNKDFKFDSDPQKVCEQVVIVVPYSLGYAYSSSKNRQHMLGTQQWKKHTNKGLQGSLIYDIQWSLVSTIGQVV